MVTLTEYVAVIGIPSNPLDVKASEYTFTTISFDAPAHSTVPELAELAVRNSEEHLTVTQFKTEREQERLAQLQEVSALAQVEARIRRQHQLRRKRPRPGLSWTM